MVHCSNSVKMVEGVVYLLTLFTDKWLYEPTIIINANHC